MCQIRKVRVWVYEFMLANVRGDLGNNYCDELSRIECAFSRWLF